jgi:hypothetical protein
MSRKSSTRLVCVFSISKTVSDVKVFSSLEMPKRCPICVGDNKIPGEDYDLCDFHAQHVLPQVEALLEAFNGDWHIMIGTILKIGTFRVSAITPEILANILNTHLNWNIVGVTKSLKPSRFNSTQS